MVKRFSNQSRYNIANLICNENGYFITKIFDKYLVKSKINEEVKAEFKSIEELHQWAIEL